MRRRHILCVLLVVLLLSGCGVTIPLPWNNEPTNPTAPSTPAPPANQFQPLANTPGDGVHATYAEIEAADGLVVAFGRRDAFSSVTTAQWSDDGAQTWHEIELATQLRELDRVSLLRKTQEGWWALGQWSTLKFALTSSDGKTWSTTPLVGVDENQFFNAVQVTGSTLVAAGQTNPAEGRLQVTFWTSTDGVTWKLSQRPTDGWVTGIAQRGSTLVAVGSQDGTVREESVPVVWRSHDGGKSWTQQQALPVGADESDFNTWLTDVVADGKGFVASAQYWSKSLAKYRTMTYSSSDGIRWSVNPVQGLTTRIVDSASLLPTPNGIYLVLTLGDKESSHPEFYRRSGDSWTSVKVNAPNPEGSWDFKDFVVDKENILLVGNRNSAQTSTGEVWWSQDQGKSFGIKPSDGTSAATPVVLPTDLARTKDGYMAIGTSHGLPVVWHGNAADGFGEPTAVSTKPTERMDGIATGNGSNLIYGSYSGIGNSKARAWLAAPGKPVVALNPPFDHGAQFNTSDIRRVRFINGQWWLVGSHSTNGSLDTSAMILNSKDGGSWSSAKAHQVYLPKNEVRQFEVSDLAGDKANGRIVNDIGLTATGLVAVGLTTDDTSDTKPVYWRQEKTGAWSIHWLPMTGLKTAYATSIAVSKEKIVVQGAGFKNDRDFVSYVWVSSDQGKTWDEAEIKTKTPQAGVGWVHAVANGFVALGGTGELNAEPVLYRSTDGLRWEATALPSLRTDPEHQTAWVPAMIANETSLTLLVQVTSLDGLQGWTRIMDVPL